jgi:hypothetical protein
MKIHYKIPLPEGKTIAELSSSELCQQRDAFTHWLDQQQVHIHNEDKPFLNALKTLIQYNQGNVNFLPEQADEAATLLSKGFSFNSEQKEHHQPKGQRAKPKPKGALGK